MNPATKSRIASTAFALTLAAGAVVIAPQDAHGATGPVTSGSGWKLQTNITHVDTQPYTIAFHDATSRTRLTPYVKNVATELKSYGIPVTLTTRIVPTTVGKCPPSHTISYRWISKPNPDRPNQSFTGTCALKGATYSAYVYINSDYWATGRRFYEWQRMNVIWHESGHAVGLSHPATCPKNSAGLQPLMCADTYKDLRTRRYSSYEATAFRHLITNRAYYPLP
ncbi:hypothetical protein ACGFNY_44135 [Streptomyces chartreusis]|uniref:hypothetical protein n=1 Tax=Streptomyces chartreusis TaxID=1969 RepID=UPI0037177E83